MAAKAETVELPDYKIRHKKLVERRRKYLSLLTPKQRQVRDDYVAWVRWWKREYGKLSSSIHNTKDFVHHQGHNNLETLKLAMRGLEKQRLRARTMLYARQAAKVVYAANMAFYAPKMLVTAS